MKEYWFVRSLGLAEGKLTGKPGEAEFYRDYAVKIANIQPTSTPLAPSSLSGLIKAYQASSDFRNLSPKTQIDYSAHLAKIQERFGANTPLKGVLDDPRMRKHVEKWHLDQAERPRSADLSLSVMHKLLQFGVNELLLRRNPASKIKKLYESRRASIIWTEEDIEQFCRSSPASLAQAVRLAYATGQRQGDLLQLTWAQVSERGVKLTTAKTGLDLFIPMYDELREVLEHIPRSSVYVLTGPQGRPWRSDTFRHAFKHAFLAAGVSPNLHFHDLRGSALKAFADAGCSELELRAISGHSMKALPGALGNYIAAFESLAFNAVRKRENAYRTKSANQKCKPALMGGTR